MSSRLSGRSAERLHAHACGSVADQERLEANSQKPSEAVRRNGSPPLVSTPISQRNAVKTIEVFRNTIKFKRPFYGEAPEPPDRSSTEIQGFSRKSQQRLRFTAINSGQPLISQFCATYHDCWPIDGREAKRQLNTFLQAIRRKFPDIGYLWALEFQTRNAPHFHLFLTRPASVALRRWLGATWSRIADPTSEQHLWWHTERVESNGQSALIDWNMGSGAYICKYLDKQAQKIVPEGFRNTGRFWGSSRGLVPEPVVINPRHLERISLFDAEFKTGENVKDSNALTYIMRHVGRYHEHQFKRSFFRKTSLSASVMTGAPIFKQLFKHLKENHHERTEQKRMHSAMVRSRNRGRNRRAGYGKTRIKSSRFATFCWLAGDQNTVIGSHVRPDSDPYSPF